MRRMRTMTAVVVALCALACAMTVQAVKQGDGAMTKMGDGTVVVNTTSLCQVKGYRSTTPLKIFIKNDKIDHIEALKNQETPKYFKLVKDQILQAWNGKTVKKAVKQKVDGVTGATMSSDAVKANVKAGLEYYQKKK